MVVRAGLAPSGVVRRAAHLRAVALAVGIAILAIALGYTATMPAYWASGAMHGDFGTFLASGAALLHHQNPYGIYPTTFHFRFHGHMVFAPNLNPPILLYPLTLVAHVPPTTGFRVWYWTSALLYLGALCVVARSAPEGTTPLRLAWAIALAGFWETLMIGQIYVVLLLIVVAAWIALRRRHMVIAGICIGLLVAVKPVFGLWPLFLLAGGFALPALVALSAAFLLTVLPLVLSGPGVYREWLGAMKASQELVPTAGNLSLPAVAGHARWEMAGYAFAALLVAGLVWYVRRTRPSVDRASTFAIMAALLVGPLTWVGYLLFLLPALWRRWSPLMTVGAVLLAVPYVITIFAALPPFVSSFFALPVAILLLEFLREGEPGVGLPLDAGVCSEDRRRVVYLAHIEAGVVE